ncbi:hypothetical protein GCM10010240_46000 [Streptomyces griseoviridis]|nr:hypothetical protein GCM10010240_46000 [Streptomyces griseoviridis]
MERSAVRAFPDSGPAATGEYDHLAEQWAREHPGEDPGARDAVELRLRPRCSPRVWRAGPRAGARGTPPGGRRAARVPGAPERLSARWARGATAGGWCAPGGC